MDKTPPILRISLRYGWVNKKPKDVIREKVVWIDAGTFLIDWFA